MDEKPLHVRVAEALGWTDVHLEPHGGREGTPAWYGTRPASDHVYVVVVDAARWFGIPPFDESWSATGPLIERLGINLVDVSHDESAEDLDGRTTHVGHVKEWVATQDLPIVRYDEYNGLVIDGEVEAWEVGRTPLVAVCELILALHAAGKLAAA